VAAGSRPRVPSEPMPPNSVASVWPSPGGSCVLVVARSCHLSRSRVAPQLSIATAMQHRWPVGGEVASGVCPPIEPLAPLLLSKPASSLRFLPCESTSEGAPSCEGRDYSGSSLIHCHNFQSSGQARALHRLVSMFEQSSLLMAAACSSAMRAAPAESARALSAPSSATTSLLCCRDCWHRMGRLERQIDWVSLSASCPRPTTAATPSGITIGSGR